jgi:general secretion pathway protein M
MIVVYIDRFRGWWNTLTQRERVLVGTLGVLLALFILVYGIVKPLQAARAAALADIRTYETLSARIRAAPALGPSGPPPRTGAADVIVTSSASSSGVAAQVQPIPGGARATVATASYDAVLGWLADLARTSTLSVTRVDLRPTGTPGQVSATIEFRG